MYCNLCIGYIYPHGGEEEDRAVFKSRTSQKNEQSELSFLLSPSLQLRDILIDLTLRPTDSATVVAQYIFISPSHKSLPSNRERSVHRP